MTPLAFSMLAFVILASAPASAVEPAGSGGSAAHEQALAFQGWRETEAAPELEVTFATRTIEVASGDVLEYDFYPAAVRALRAGVEIDFEDGSTLAPPLLAGANAAPSNPMRSDPEEGEEAMARTGATAAWVHRRVSLDAQAGSKTASFRLAARGAPRGASTFYVDHVAIQRAGAAPIVLFDGALASPWREAISAGGGAACFPVEHAARYPRSYVPAGSVEPRDPWTLVDLTAFRRRSAAGDGSRASSGSSPGAIRATEAGTRAADRDPDPSGVVYLDAGVPFRFARSDEARAISADGQSLGLGNLEGGRFYELHLAVAVEGGAAIDTAWRILGREGSTRTLSIHLDPRTAERAAADFFTLSVPVAAEFQIQSLRLPRDPRFSVLAASLRWRKAAPADPEFRRRWMANEVSGQRLERYFRDVDVGVQFAELARSPVLAGEVANERKLFDLAVQRDAPAFEVLLASRLAAFAEASAKFKANHIAFFGCLAATERRPGDGPGEASARDLKRAIEAGRARPELEWVAPSMRSLPGLSAADPAEIEALRTAAAAGRVDLVRGAWAGGGAGGASESMAREILLGCTFAQRYLGAGSAASAAARGSETSFGVLGSLPRDLAYACQLPQLCRSAGIDALVGVTGADCDRPAAFAWKAPDGSCVSAVAGCRAPVHGARGELRERDLADRLQRARGDGIRADILMAFDVGDGSAQGLETLRRNLATIARLADTDLAPSVSIQTPTSWLANVAGDAPLPAWDGAREMAGPGSSIAVPARVRAANRRAEAALERSERYAALAAADGLVYLREEFDGLWQRLLSNQAIDPRTRADSSAVEEDSRRIVARAQDFTRGELDVLTRSADTRGPGRAIAVFNPLPWERSAPIEINGADTSVLDSDLRPVVSQLTANGTRVFMAALPSLGRAVFHLVQGAGGSTAARVAPGSDGWTIANRKLSITFDPKTGRMRSLKLLPGGDEWLAPAGLGGNAILLLPRRAANADVAGHAAPKPEIVDGLDSVQILERGPVRSLARIERTVHGARVVQEIVLYADTPEVTIHTRIEGDTGGGRLCSVFEIEPASPWVVHGVPFGSTMRTCAESDLGTEIHALDWIAASRSRSSFTLCDDAGASFGAAGGVLSVTLDDPGEDTDPSPREIECTLHVEQESWRAGAMHAAAELEHPPQVVPAASHDGLRPPRYSFLRLGRIGPDRRAVEGPRSGLQLSALKLAEDGDDWVLRIYETRGETGTARLTLDRSVYSAYGTDLLEHPAGELRVSGREVEIPIEAFQIETVRLKLRAR